MPNINGNILQLLIVLGFFGFSILTWVVRKLQEQAAIRRQQQMREQARIEALRTGRVASAESGPKRAGPTGQITREQKLAELAAKRARQQHPARGSAQVRTTGQSPARMPSPPRTTSTAGGAAPHSARSPAQRRLEMIAARRREIEARQQAIRKSRQQKKPIPKQDRRKSPKVDNEPSVVKPTLQPRLRKSEVAVVKSSYKIPVVLGEELNRDQLRRAFVLKEILDPPVAMREDEAF